MKFTRLLKTAKWQNQCNFHKKVIVAWVKIENQPELEVCRWAALLARAVLLNLCAAARSCLRSRHKKVLLTKLLT